MTRAVLLLALLAPPKTIDLRTELGPNYLWHLLAAARVGYNSDYAARYAAAVDPADLAFLQEKRALLEFGNGRSGPLTFVAVFLPAYLNLDTEQKYAAYFDALLAGFRTGEFTNFFAAYPVYERKDPFLEMNRPLFDAAHKNPAQFASGLPDLERIGQIVRRNFARYQAEVWPEVRPLLERRRTALAAQIETADLIGAWERLTGLAFAAPRYQILLCYACANGPDMNSLSYDRNVFYSEAAPEVFLEQLSHEVGTHLLAPVGAEVRAAHPEVPAATHYAAYETLAMFLNRRALGATKLAYRLPAFGDQERLRFYEENWKEGVTARDLLLKAESAPPYAAPMLKLSPR